MSRTPGPVSFGRFLQAVTKFSPGALLPLLAAEGCRQTARHRENPTTLLDGPSPVTPWAICEIARETIVHGIYAGQRPPTPDDVGRLCALQANLSDPISEQADESLDRFLVRIAFEQFRWQLSEFEELARPHALLVEAASRVPEATAFRPAEWRGALGCSLDEFVSLGFFLFVWAAQHEGWVDLDWMALPHFAEVRARHSPETVTDVVNRRLAVTFDEFRRMDPSPKSLPHSVAEHRFNPLNARPFLRMRDGRLLAPHPLLLLHRLGVNGLYYDRCQEPGFTDQLGPVFETYVGMQLRLLANAAVHPAVEFARSDESVDWFVVLPRIVLLIEAKATRLTQDARTGLDRLDEDRDRTLGKAYDQIERTVARMRSGHAALGFLPRDRPLRGLVVTLEPYWNAVSGFGPQPTASIPTTVASIREVEHLSAVGRVHSVDDALATLPAGHSNQAIVGALKEFPTERNPLLDHGWEASLGADDQTV